MTVNSLYIMERVTSGLDIMERLPAGLSCIMKRITFALEDSTSQEQGPGEWADKFPSRSVMNLPQFFKGIDITLSLILGEGDAVMNFIS